MESLERFIEIAKKDSKAELECKLLSGKIQTKNVSNKISETLLELALSKPTEISLLRISYPDNIRVEISTPELIQKVCATNSFKGIPLEVQKKALYHRDSSNNDTIDIPDTYTKFTLRTDEVIRKDWDASPTDPKTTSIRLLNRRSYITKDELFRIDFSMVKSRRMKKQSLRDILKEEHTYELEIEFIKRETKISSSEIVEQFTKLIKKILQTYHQSEFILTPLEEESYLREFKLSKHEFINPVTFKREHLKEGPHSIWEGYTVTIKADGERSGLYVARDRKLLRITSRPLEIRWTGLKALSDSFHGTFMDGEYISELNLYCIFDCYSYKGKNTTQLHLMGNDEKSRLGCAGLFIDDIKKEFVTEPTTNPLKIQRKIFKAGDGKIMENAIKDLLETKYDYETDGLIFTPNLSPVAPESDRDGITWKTVYKWKPPYQNSIDFLIKFTNEETYDPVLNTQVRKGHLFVSQRIGDVLLYPCETMTGEFVSKDLPSDLKALSDNSPKIPAYFQPSNPKNPDAYEILVPIEKGLAYDIDKQRVETNTIIECSYNTEKSRWIIMRTRYEKTLQFKSKQKQYGNDYKVADDIWNSIHVPVTEDMIKTFVSSPLDETMFDDTYYIQTNRTKRVLNNSYNFHNKIKDLLYEKCTKENQTLLDLGSGQGGDMHKWKKQRLSKVVGIEYSESNIKLACERYVKDKIDKPTEYRPHILYVKGDITQPLYQQESTKYKILNGEEKGQTKYLEQFNDLKKFDNLSCQFVIHYACESEETFRIFVKNISQHCKEYFFGTCPDGKTVYSLLAGKKSHKFTNGKEIGGEYEKEYEDTEQWSESFGKSIKVSMESYEPKREFIVPFQKITEIFKEEGFELEESHMFQELYNNTLNLQEQEFSFINRTFIFRKSSKKELEPEFQKDENEIPKESKESKESKEEEKPKRKLKIKTKIEEKDLPILFHGSGEDKGEYKFLDNQSEYPIQINDKKYLTIEHYFQAMKAEKFNDNEILEKIMNTPSAKAVKALGKKVKNFIKEVWDSERLDIMIKGVRAKFVQHPELQKKLLETGTKQIGEADARDSFWGIGTSSSTEISKDPSKWKGQNQLGKILMILRDEFKD